MLSLWEMFTVVELWPCMESSLLKHLSSAKEADDLIHAFLENILEGEGPLWSYSLYHKMQYSHHAGFVGQGELPLASLANSCPAGKLGLAVVHGSPAQIVFLPNFSWLFFCSRIFKMKHVKLQNYC